MRKGRFAGLGAGDGDGADGHASRSGAGESFTTIAGGLGLAMVATAALLGLPTFLVLVATGIGSALIVAAGLGDRHRRSPRLPVDAADGSRAQGFVSALEEGGRGWFWETNAEGTLTYLSPPLAAALERDGVALVGRPFAELLLVEEHNGEGGDRPTLGFHLGARFPFENVIVTPNGKRDGGWLLSGAPRFDEVGRFLGFRGFGTPLTADRREAAQSDRMARFDSLTGLANRGSMEAMLDEALANADRRKQSCALFLVDLDRFKQVNDTFGHPAGDVLLQQVAERLATVLDGDGQAGRLGGDEFMAVFPGIGEEGRLAAAAEKLIRIVSAPFVIHGHAVSIGASVGVAISRPGRTYRQALVKEADLALYAAKRAGRGTFRFFEAAMHAEESDRKVLESDLKSAVAKGQLKLLYQPMVSVATETLVGFEALVRWSHPTRGPLAPAEFLPIAEASGQMPALGDWIVRTACAEAAAWPAHLRLAVNLSRGQLTPGLPAVLTGALAASGLAPDRLELDVQEEALLGDAPVRRAALHALDGLGVGLCLDDYGTGAVSLASFSAARLARVKLHPDFLRAGLNPRSRSRGVLAALMRLAESLDVAVTAEGAETLEDLELIRALGCGEVQGFLFGRPMSSEEALGLAAQSKPVDAREAAQTRSPRHSLIRVGALAVGGDGWPVRLRNVSVGGAMLESERAVATGTAVALDLSDGVTIAGTVRWAQGGRIGVQFDSAFDLARLGRIRREPIDARTIQPDFIRPDPAPAMRISIRETRGR